MWCIFCIFFWEIRLGSGLSSCQVEVVQGGPYELTALNTMSTDPSFNSWTWDVLSEKLLNVTSLLCVQYTCALKLYSGQGTTSDEVRIFYGAFLEAFWLVDFLAKCSPHPGYTHLSMPESLGCRYFLDSSRPPPQAACNTHGNRYFIEFDWD